MTRTPKVTWDKKKKHKISFTTLTEWNAWIYIQMHVDSINCIALVAFSSSGITATDKAMDSSGSGNKW